MRNFCADNTLCGYRSPAAVNLSHDLLCGDARGLDDRPPLLDLGLLVGAERLRRELIRRRDDLAELDEALTDGRIAQGISERLVELADHVPRCPLGGPD